MTQWRKSTKSASGNCVEVARQNGQIFLRESDDPNHFIVTSPAKFAAFLQGAKAGEFDEFAAEEKTGKDNPDTPAKSTPPGPPEEQQPSPVGEPERRLEDTRDLVAA